MSNDLSHGNAKTVTVSGIVAAPMLGGIDLREVPAPRVVASADNG